MGVLAHLFFRATKSAGDYAHPTSSLPNLSPALPGRFHFFSSIIPSISLGLFAVGPINGTVANPDQTLAWHLWTTRRGALVCVLETPTGSPSEIPVSSNFHSDARGHRTECNQRIQP
jgi:hypothetical protein